MNRDDVLGFVNRDWAAIGQSRLRYWAERYAREGEGPARHASTILYEHLRRLREWPTPEDRARDLADHLRLSRLLERAASAFTRR